jgi:hypothetical protein
MITLWRRLDRFLARLRPHREPLSLPIDSGVVALAWNINGLFRLGFERWLSAHLAFDGCGLAAIVVAYAAAFIAFSVPQSLWRFARFKEVKRLTLACLLAGLVSEVLVMLWQRGQMPHAVLALHPVVALMGLALVRLADRLLYGHGRSRLTGRDVEARRATVMGAGEPARRLRPVSTSRAGSCGVCSTTTRPSGAQASAACRCWDRRRRLPTRPGVVLPALSSCRSASQSCVWRSHPSGEGVNGQRIQQSQCSACGAQRQLQRPGSSPKQELAVGSGLPGLPALSPRYFKNS